MKMLKIILISVVLLVEVVFAKNVSYSDELKNLSSSQMSTLIKVMKVSKENFNDPFILSAIAWKESSLGRNIRNPTDGGCGSYGLYANLTRTVGKRYGISMNSAKFNLLYKDGFSDMAVVDELRYWKKIHHGNKLKMYGSYNGGFKGSKKYARDIQMRIIALKKFNFRNTKKNIKEVKETEDGNETNELFLNNSNDKVLVTDSNSETNQTVRYCLLRH